VCGCVRFRLFCGVRFSRTCSFEFVFIIVAGLFVDRIKSISNKDPFFSLCQPFYCRQGEVWGVCLHQSRTVWLATVSLDTLIFCFSFFIVTIMSFLDFLCMWDGRVRFRLFFVVPSDIFLGRFSRTCSFEFVFVIVAGLLLDRIKIISNKNPFFFLCQLLYC